MNKRLREAHNLIKKMRDRWIYIYIYTAIQIEDLVHDFKEGEQNVNGGHSEYFYDIYV